MKTYLIADISVHDMEKFNEYRQLVPEIIAKHGGQYLVRGGKSEVKEGRWQPGRLVVIQFPSRKEAQAFLDDPEYAPIAQIRWAAAKTNLVLVDGL